MNRCAQAVAPLFDFSATPDRPSVWMEENLVLPALMSPRSPGPLSFRTVPWAREILDQWHPERGTRVSAPQPGATAPTVPATTMTISAP